MHIYLYIVVERSDFHIVVEGSDFHIGIEGSDFHIGIEGSDFHIVVEGRRMAFFTKLISSNLIPVIVCYLLYYLCVA